MTRYPAIDLRGAAVSITGGAQGSAGPSQRRSPSAAPGYVGALASAAAVTPEPVLTMIRRMIGDDRALRPDTADRAAHRSRLRPFSD